MSGRPYLLSWRLEDRKVVVVGGGSIGTGKIETLLGTGARIVVVDPAPSRRVEELSREGMLFLRRRRARPTDMVAAALVVAATGDSAVNRRLRRWAKVAGAVVNAVDDKQNCDVTVPAAVHRGPATIAISTDGASPAASRFLREELAGAVDHAIPLLTAEVVGQAAEARGELRRTGHYRYDYPAWRDGFFKPAMDAVRSGHLKAVDDVKRRFVAEFDSAAQHRPGRVTLVGAGPGDPDLITVRGARSLACAAVVVYDRLVDQRTLALAPAAAERIPVGKGKGFGHTQDEINSLLIERALAGDDVVRLKGGDPFVFGRGGEEADALAAAGVGVDVVPGISSALSAPLLAGIPVTDRRHAASFTVVTGHRATQNHDGGDPWTTGASETMVVLMAATTADRVARRLRAGGRPGTEPVAFIHRAGSPLQEVEVTCLDEVERRGCPFPSPTVMVVGPVAAMARRSEGEVRWDTSTLMTSRL